MVVSVLGQKSGPFHDALLLDVAEQGVVLASDC